MCLHDSKSAFFSVFSVFELHSPTALSFAFAYHDCVKHQYASKMLCEHCNYLKPVQPACTRHGAIGLCNICTNTRLVVMELIVAISVQKSIYLQYITIRLCARELVAGAVETQDERPPRMHLLYRPPLVHRIVRDV